MSDDEQNRIVSSSFTPITKIAPKKVEGAKYPHIKVKLVGTDGNAFALLGKVHNEMKRHKVPAEDIGKFFEEATSGDYDHLLQTIMKYVNTQ